MAEALRLDLRLRVLWVQSLVDFRVGAVGLLHLDLLVDEGVWELLAVHLLSGAAVAEDLGVLLDDVLEAACVLSLHRGVEGEALVFPIIVCIPFPIEVIRVEIIAVVVGVSELQFFMRRRKVVRARPVQRSLLRVGVPG